MTRDTILKESSMRRYTAAAAVLVLLMAASAMANSYSTPDIDGRVTQRHVESTLLPTQLGWWVIFGPTRDHRGELLVPLGPVLVGIYGQVGVDRFEAVAAALVIGVG